MAKHTVNQGECLASIAKMYGFSDWKVIYDDSQNADFRKKRPNPNILKPGDELFIPDKDSKSENGQSDQTVNFKLNDKIVPTLLRIVLQNPDGTPMAKKKYLLKVDEDVFENTTAQDGLVEHEIPPDARSGELTVWVDDDDDEGVTYELELGCLDPIEEITGIQARLNNLGYNCGSEDGELNEQTKEALKSFQADKGLKPTGEVNDDVKKKLEDLHDKK